MTEFIEAGEFVSTFGINGELKLYPYSDNAQTLCALKRLFIGAKELKLEGVREHKNMCLVKIEGITNPELARELIGKTALFKRVDIPLPKGRHYVQDVLGCTVKDVDSGEIYGTVKNILRPAAQDIYTVINDKGEEFMFPGVSEFLKNVDVDNRLVLIKPIEGMFTKAENADEN